MGVVTFGKGCLSLEGHSGKLCLAPSALHEVSSTSARRHHHDGHLVVPGSSAWWQDAGEAKPIEGVSGWPGG